MRGFLGVGTGRCGSRYLTRILEEKNVIRHEAHGDSPPFHWNAPRIDEIEYLASLVSSGVGVVGFPYLPAVPFLRVRIPEMPVVCMHRPRRDFIDSACRNFGTPVDNGRVPIYIVGLHPAHAWAVFWEVCEDAMARIEEPVLHVDLQHLTARMPAIRKFLEAD